MKPTQHSWRLFLSLLVAIGIATRAQSADPIFAASPMKTDATSSRPPNVVLIMADDLGVGDLGCYGQKIIRTPRLDRLASEGMRFTRFYCGNNVCAPSRCCLMTGKHPGHAYIRDNENPLGMEDLKAEFGWEFPGQIPLAASEVTFPSLLHQSGYTTAAFGKWGLGHVGTTGDPVRHGFDLFYGYYCQVHAHNHFPKFLWRNNKKEPLEGNNATLSGAIYSQDRFIDEAVQFVRTNASKPIFLYLPLTVPHLSLQVTDQALAEYADKIPEADYEHKSYLKHPKPRAAYAAMVTHMDEGIGKIVDLFEELGLSQDTIFVFTSDNGPTYDRLGGTDSDFFNSAAGLKGRKGSMWEGGIRAPLIVRWQGHVAAGIESDWLGASWDIGPTLCELAGTRFPSHVDGISFAPTLLGKEQVFGHNYLYWESPGYGGQQAVRCGNWKAIRQNMTALNKQGKPIVTQLFDLREDPAESNDIASQKPALVRQIEGLMQGLHVPSKLFPLPGVDGSEKSTSKSILVAGGGNDPEAKQVGDLKLIEPFAVDFDRDGGMVFCEMTTHRVKRIDRNGNVTSIAGTGEKGMSGNGGPALQATFNGPHHLLFDATGDLLIADSFNGSVRKWEAKTGILTSFAGNGQKGFAGDGGLAAESMLSGAYSIDFNRERTKLYIADLENHRIRMVDLKTSIISTIAGNGKAGVPEEGGLAIEQPLSDPRAVAVDERGGVYILERGGHALRRVGSDGKIRTVVGTGKAGFSGDGGPALKAQLNGPKHLIVDAEQNVLIVDTENHAIRRFIPSTGRIERVAGTGVAGSEGLGQRPDQLQLNRPHGVQVGPDGWLYISDSSNGRIVKVKSE